MGAKVIAGKQREALLDGDACHYDIDKGYTMHDIKGVRDDCIIIKLGTPTIINHIRMLLWDKDLR